MMPPTYFLALAFRVAFGGPESRLTRISRTSDIDCYSQPGLLLLLFLSTTHSFTFFSHNFFSKFQN